ncbi:hypothetical protein [Curtobacterium poinsettiae]|uniref:hypothetical protein n=1 Tax=Curtobacterium poinsettiae TaxID=159612 RepID=UPI0021C65C07|nr:hypothetical protein [Curtobacterium flaccumfaciens]UXN13550.1 hypothetical protein N8D76_08775 [Curtobacterium flaccumfaciens pv. poinsettiae]
MVPIKTEYGKDSMEGPEYMHGVDVRIALAEDETPGELIKGYITNLRAFGRNVYLTSHFALKDESDNVIDFDTGERRTVAALTTLDGPSSLRFTTYDESLLIDDVRGVELGAPVTPSNGSQASWAE